MAQENELKTAVTRTSDDPHFKEGFSSKEKSN
jgi:hypothetical protein